MRCDSHKLQLRPEAHQGAGIRRGRMRVLRHPPRRLRHQSRFLPFRPHPSGHRRARGPGGDRFGYTDNVRPGEEHNLPEHSRGPVRVHRRRQDIHRRQHRRLFRIPGLPSRVLRSLRGDAPRGDEGGSRRESAEDTDPHTPRFQSGHRPQGEEARCSAASELVLLQRRGEGLRPLRFMQAQAGGVRGSGIQG